MQIRTKYILFVAFIHLLALGLSFYIFIDNKLIFFICEVLILLSLWISRQLYKQLIQPIKMLLRGAEAMADKDFNVKFVKTGKYELDELITVYNQMMDQLRTERTQQEQQHYFLDKLIATSPTGIIIQDFDEKINNINPKALQLLKLNEQEINSNSKALMDHPVIKEINSLKTGTSKVVNFNGINTFKLQKAHFIDRGFTRNFIMIEELTAEILAAEKKVYGKVIRMIAHEVNNTIGPVNSIIESTLGSGFFLKESRSKLLREALEVAVNRNKNLASFVRNFADVVRLPIPVKIRVNINELVGATGKLMEFKALEKDILFDYHLSKDPLYIMCDAAQMEQVLVNIIKNSIEAISGKGVISFYLDKDKNYLVVKDSGKGIPAESSGQLFSPFYSTKKDGQGIGLTLVKEILLNHAFEFSLVTGNDGFTRFKIEF